MSRYRIVFLGLFCALTQLACSTTSDSKINYKTSIITPTLEIPPDLVTPAADKNLDLPGSKVGKPENTGRFVETGNLNVEAKVLPEINDIRLQREGDVYWLSVDRPAEKVYPLVKDFWAEQGFRLVKDEPLIGIQETEWLSIKSGNDSFFATLLASLRAAESRDQYKTRVERSADDSTRIFVAHRGQELIIDENSDALDNTGLKQGWQFVPSDSTKEVEMLSRLMIFLGMQEGQVKQQLVNLGGLSPRASLQKDKDDQPFLMVNSGLQQTLNRVHYKMDKRAIAISDENIQSNEVVLTLDGKALNALEVLKKSGDNISIRLEGSANSNTTRIDVLNAAGSSVHDDEALKLLGFLLEQLR